MRRKAIHVVTQPSAEKPRLEKLLNLAKLGLQELAEASEMQLNAPPVVNSELLLLSGAVMALEGILNRLERDYFSASLSADEAVIDNFYGYTDQILFLCKRTLTASASEIEMEELTIDELESQFKLNKPEPLAGIAGELETYVLVVRMLFQLVWEEKHEQEDLGNSSHMLH